MSDEMSAEEIQQQIEHQERHFDQWCAEIKAKENRDCITSSVRPEEMPLAQWEGLVARIIAEGDAKIDEAFRRLKLMQRCFCGRGPCPVHPTGRPQ